MVPLAIGVDIATATFTAAVWSGTAGISVGTFANTPEGMAEFVAALPEPSLGEQAMATHLVLEPTGGSELMLAACALEQGWQVSMPNPKHVRDWAKSRGRRAKTDAQDALMLAQYGAEQPQRRWQPLPAPVSE